jgi:hypothetical protein
MDGCVDGETFGTLEQTEGGMCGITYPEFVFMFKYIPKCTHGRRTIARK